MSSAKSYEPMTDEQRQQWNQTGLFPVERWGMCGPDATPLVCPTPTNEELRNLASCVPRHIQLSGWYVGKPAFGRRYLYSDNFRGMGRQWVCDFPVEKGYFDGLPEYVAALHPRTILKLLDRISELEAKLSAIEAKDAHQTCVASAGLPFPIEKVIEWASQAGFTWRNPARDRCLAEFAELVRVFGSASLRELSDKELDAAIDRSGWPQNMISDFVRGKLREACRTALDAAEGKVNSKVNSGGIHGQA